MLYLQYFFVYRLFGLSYIATELVFCLCLTLLFHDGPWNALGVISRSVDLLCTFLVLALLNSLILWLFGDIRWERWVVLPVITVLHLPFVNNRDWTSRVVMGGVFLSTYLLIFTISADGANWLRELGLLPPGSGGFDATGVAGVVMPVLTLIYLRHLSISSFRHRHGACTALILVMVVVSAVFQAAFDRPTEESADFLRIRLAACLILWVVELLAYYMLYAVTKEYNHSLELQATKLREDTDRIIADFSGANFEELRKLRHDLRNHMAYIGTLLEQGKYDDAKQYFSAMSVDVSAPLGYTDSGNDAVNAIVNFERMRAATLSVALAPKLSVPAKLPLPDNELCSLLSNLLDNAIEAAAASDADDKTVELSVFRRESYLLIDVRNPVSADVSPERRLSLVSTKQDSQLHGYGTKIIRGIAAQYNGICRFDMEDGRFIASVMLELDEHASPEGPLARNGEEE